VIGRKRAILLKPTLLFLGGGIGYYLLEVIFRGHSHWSMALCGGISLVGIYFINRKFSERTYAARALLCALLITAVEFVTGCIVNLWLGWNVWSYSRLHFNLLGQVSLLFSCIWFFLSLGICLIISTIERRSSLRKTKELSD